MRSNLLFVSLWDATSELAGPCKPSLTTTSTEGLATITSLTEESSSTIPSTSLDESHGTTTLTTSATVTVDTTSYLSETTTTEGTIETSEAEESTEMDITTSFEITTTIDTTSAAATTSAAPLSCAQLDNPYTVDGAQFGLECCNGILGGAGIANVWTDDFVSCIKACADEPSCNAAQRRPSTGICSLFSSFATTDADVDSDSCFRKEDTTTTTDIVIETAA
ncbi:hypothetical protein BFJ70_g12661 [Fusarium oxysporum]|nr:hypothetical protein BFJ70_g12661 [Fusarium oxysporum]